VEWHVLKPDTFANDVQEGMGFQGPGPLEVAGYIFHTPDNTWAVEDSDFSDTPALIGDGLHRLCVCASGSRGASEASGEFPEPRHGPIRSVQNAITQLLNVLNYSNDGSSQVVCQLGSQIRMNKPYHD